MVFKIQLATKKGRKRNKKCHEYDFADNIERLQEYTFCSESFFILLTLLAIIMSKLYFMFCFLLQLFS